MYFSTRKKVTRATHPKDVHLVLKRTDSVLVLDPKVILDVLLKDDDGIRVLFGSTRWTLIRRFKPSEDTLRVKRVRARKTFRRF